MKNTFVVTQLETYDANKGYKRTFIRDEPHIKELRGFVAEIKGKERELSATELLKLARILLGKNNRSEEQLSSQIFKGIADELGGFDVLDLLDTHKILDGDNLLFLEKNPANAGQLAPQIVILNQKLSLKHERQLLNDSMTMTADDRLSLFLFLVKTANQDHLCFYVMFIHCLHEHAIQIDNFLALLRDTKNIIFAHCIVEKLLAVSKELLTADNVSHILQLQNSYVVEKLLEELPVTQALLDNLFKLDGNLNYHSSGIIKIFKAANWDLTTWLQQILTAGEHCFTLSLAIEQLEKSKINSDKLPQIFPFMFAYPKHASNFVEALKIVSQPELPEEDLKLLQGGIQNPVPVAKAIVALREANLFSDLNINVIIAYPEHAFGLAKLVIVFEKLKKFPYLEAHRIIQEHPEYALKTAMVLECLLENTLDQAVNIRTVCEYRQSHALLYPLMNILKKANLLNQDNLDLLIPKHNYFKTLTSAASCLANAEKLNQDNWEKLITDPLNALFFAEKQGGKIYPCTFKFLADKGAENLVSIRDKARVMAQGQRQGFFFAEHTEEKNETFVKATGKTISQAQHEAMVKIAEYCGTSDLEDETLQHIASTIYSSSLGR